MSADATTSTTVYYGSSYCSSSSSSVTSSTLTNYSKIDPRTEDLKQYAKKVQRFFTGKIFPSKKSSEPIIEDLEQT
jgi:hypothetical protein